MKKLSLEARGLLRQLVLILMALRAVSDELHRRLSTKGCDSRTRSEAIYILS